MTDMELKKRTEAAEQQLREAKDKLAVFEREIRRVEATPRNRRNIGEQYFIGWVANADGLGRDYITALTASAQPTGGTRE